MIPDNSPPPELSLRELQVLQALADGLRQKEIALRLGIQPRTVRDYLAGLRRKLGARTTQQLTGRAAALGLCQPARINPEP